MRLLLDGRYSPTIDSGGFIEATAEECADWWVEWSPQFVAHRKIAVTASSLPEALRSYLEHMGIRAFDEDFYRPADGAFVVERMVSWDADRSVLLDEARSRW
jgi:hypothetical protein